MKKKTTIFLASEKMQLKCLLKLIVKWGKWVTSCKIAEINESKNNLKNKQQINEIKKR